MVDKEGEKGSWAGRGGRRCVALLRRRRYLDHVRLAHEERVGRARRIERVCAAVAGGAVGDDARELLVVDVEGDRVGQRQRRRPVGGARLGRLAHELDGAHLPRESQRRLLRAAAHHEALGLRARRHLVHVCWVDLQLVGLADEHGAARRAELAARGAIGGAAGDDHAELLVHDAEGDAARQRQHARPVPRVARRRRGEHDAQVGGGAAQLQDARGAVLVHDEVGGALVEAVRGRHDQHVRLAHVQPRLAAVDHAARRALPLADGKRAAADLAPAGAHPLLVGRELVHQPRELVQLELAVGGGVVPAQHLGDHGLLRLQPQLAQRGGQLSELEEARVVAVEADEGKAGGAVGLGGGRRVGDAREDHRAAFGVAHLVADVVRQRQ